MNFYQLSPYQIPVQISKQESMRIREMDLKTVLVSDIQKNNQLIAILYPQLHSNKLILNIYEAVIAEKHKKFKKKYSEQFSINRKNLNLCGLTHLKALKNSSKFIADKKSENIELDFTVLIITNSHICLLTLNNNSNLIVHCKYEIANNNSKVYNCQVSLQQQYILLCFRNDDRKITLNCYFVSGIEKSKCFRYDLQLIYHDILNARQIVAQFNRQKTQLEPRQTVISSYEFEFSLSVLPGFKSNVSITVYPSVIENYAIINIFEWKYQIYRICSGNKTIMNMERVTENPQQYSLVSLHNNFSIKAVKRLFNSLALCYVMHQIKPQCCTQFSSNIMIYDTFLNYTKNIISIDGIITDCFIDTDQQPSNDHSRLIILSEIVAGNKAQKQINFLKTNIIFTPQVSGLSYNPYFSIQTTEKPLVSHSNSYDLGLLDPSNSMQKQQIRLIAREKHKKNLIYWKFCQSLQFIDKNNNGLIGNIIEMLN